MKNLKFVLLAFVLTLSLFLLSSCGDDAGTPHPGDCAYKWGLAENG